MKIDIFIGRIVAGGRAGDGPVRGCIDISHGEFQTDKRFRAPGKGRRAQQAPDDFLFGALPRKALGDINWMDGA